MNAERSRTITIQVDVATCASESRPTCRSCLEPLELVQPVIGVPDSMLGVCPGCGAWHYLTDEPGGSGLLVARLPLSAIAGSVEPPGPTLAASGSRKRGRSAGIRTA